MKQFLLFLSAILIATAQQKSLHPQYQVRSDGLPSATLMNINRLSVWFQSNGVMESNPFTGNSGATYPRSTTTAVFSSGLIWGGYVSDGTMSSELPRVNGTSYSTGMAPGAIVGLRTGVTEDPAAPENRIYRIRRDYATADLKLDAAELGNIAIALVDSLSVSTVRSQYAKDWKEWPAHKGAPFYDAENDGMYQPKFNDKNEPLLYPAADEPGLAGADQVIWYVANDLRNGDSPWKTKPVGLEMQVTVWGYNGPSNQGTGNTVFKRHRFFFKGHAATKDTAKLREFYIGHWSDPDLGDSGDDFVGSDSLLSAGFVYNATSPDKEYQKFSLSPPALGYILLQGPIEQGPADHYARSNFNWLKGFRNIAATSFVPFSAGTGCDSPFPIDNQSRIWYQNLRGLPSTTNGTQDPLPFIDPTTKRPTRFVFSGDPVLNTGWRDGMAAEAAYPCNISTTAGDRRFLLSTGPVTMNVGDMREVIYALVGASGSDRLASITAMKFFMKQSRQFFLGLFPDDPTGVGMMEPSIPDRFELAQNFPNPFNPSTTIRFTIPERSIVTLTVYDVIGRTVATLLESEFCDAGSHIVRWNGERMNNGIYFYRLTAAGRSVTKRVMLIK